MKIWLVKSKTELIICKTDYYISISKPFIPLFSHGMNGFYRLWCKNSGFMKNEQKIPNGIEIHAVKLNISSIRYICFWTDFSPWRVCPFDHIHSFYSNDYFCNRSQGFQSKHIPNLFLINRRSGSMILFKYFVTTQLS